MDSKTSDNTNQPAEAHERAQKGDLLRIDSIIKVEGKDKLTTAIDIQRAVSRILNEETETLDTVKKRRIGAIAFTKLLKLAKKEDGMWVSPEEVTEAVREAIEFTQKGETSTAELLRDSRK